MLLLQHVSARHVYKVRVAAFRSLIDLEHRWDGPTAALHVALKVADNREPAKGEHTPTMLDSCHLVHHRRNASSSLKAPRASVTILAQELLTDI